MPDQSAIMEALMGMAGGGGAPGGAGPPAGGMPGGGGGPGAAMGAPPQPGGPPGQGGMPGAAQGPDPGQMIQAGMLSLFLGMHQLGLTETAQKVIQLVTKSVERMTKATPQGRQGAGMAAAMPPAQPPGTGPMPGVPMT